jgi:hypothetical protein
MVNFSNLTFGSLAQSQQRKAVVFVPPDSVTVDCDAFSKHTEVHRDSGRTVPLSVLSGRR